jgi:hypothetical protein
MTRKTRLKTNRLANLQGTLEKSYAVTSQKVRVVKAGPGEDVKAMTET